MSPRLLVCLFISQSHWLAGWGMDNTKKFKCSPLRSWRGVPPPAWRWPIFGLWTNIAGVWGCLRNFGQPLPLVKATNFAPPPPPRIFLAPSLTNTNKWPIILNELFHSHRALNCYYYHKGQRFESSFLWISQISNNVIWELICTHHQQQ